MKILVSGSLAYDRIMDYGGIFGDHLLPDKLDDINVSFTVDNLTENFGGTAGNIAYALHCMGETPVLLGTLGYDHYRYSDRLKELDIDTEFVKIIESDATSSGFVTTDSQDNQITAFNLGAMKYECDFTDESLDLSEAMAIIAPGNIQDMVRLSQIYHDNNVYSIFDPSQSLPIWNGEDLRTAISQNDVTISNLYELSLIESITNLSKADFIELAGTLITTMGNEGSKIFQNGNITHIDCIHVEDVIDPTGAGDSYRGGLLKGLTLGWNLEKSCQLGAIVASRAVCSRGTQNYSISFEEVSDVICDN